MASTTPQPYGPLAVSGHARLIVAAGPCPAGLSFGLSGESHACGRSGEGIVLSEDDTVSPSHCVFSYDDGALSVEDRGSANGVYMRVRGAAPISHGEWFRVGSQYFRFDELSADTEFPDANGTLFFTSPRRKGSFRVLQMLEGGKTGMSATTSDDELTLGGEGATVAFTSDVHLSETHAKVYRNSTGSFMIEDMDSLNGTYVRVTDKQPLQHGDYVFVGNTLLRVELG